MFKREIFDSEIKKLDDIIVHYNNQQYNDFLNEIYNIRNNFKLRLLVVGHYNAGKSSLINCLIGRTSLLREDIVPETAVAAEVSYSEIENALLHLKNGKVKNAVIGEKYTSDDCDYVEYQLNSEGLKEISPFIIVDTPGIDSCIEAHNKALENYIGLGVAYLVVVDQAKGGLDRTMLNLIREISEYTDRITVLISHCDLISSESAESIRCSISDTLNSYGYNYPVYAVSKFDDDITKKMVTFINDLNAQEAYNEKLNLCIRHNVQNLYIQLRDFRDDMYLDTFDEDKKIRDCEWAIEEFDRFCKNRMELIPSSVDEQTEEVIEKIRQALNRNVKSFADTIMSGNKEGFKALIIETIRPVLIKYAKGLSLRNLNSLTDGIEKVLSDPTKLSGNAVINWSENFSERLRTELENFNADVSTDQFPLPKGDKPVKNIYKTVISLGAILTEILPPWLEVILFLLPDVISLIKIFIGDTDLDRLQNNLKETLIPEICNRLYIPVYDSIDNNIRIILKTFEESIKTEKDIMVKNLENVRELKRIGEKDFEALNMQLDIDIRSLEEIKEGE